MNTELIIILGILAYPAWRIFLWYKDPCHYMSPYSGGFSQLHNPNGFHNFHVSQLEGRVLYIFKNDPMYRHLNAIDIEKNSHWMARKLYDSNIFLNSRYGHLTALNLYLCQKMRWEILTVADLERIIEKGRY